jgi:hypothetical protein
MFFRKDDTKKKTDPRICLSLNVTSEYDYLGVNLFSNNSLLAGFISIHIETDKTGLLIFIGKSLHPFFTDQVRCLSTFYKGWVWVMVRMEVRVE